MVVLAFGTTLAAVRVVRAQPAMGANGCCCVPSGGAFVCASKTQAECLAVQPAAPSYPKLADWKKAWDDLVAASKAQEAKPLHGGWIAEACAQAEAGGAASAGGGAPRGAPPPPPAAGVLLLPEAAPDRERQVRLQAEHDRVRLPRAVLDVQGRPPAVGLHLGRGRVSALRMDVALSTSR
jgi:hypothetical protein